MRGSRFTAEQIIGVLREADAGAPTAEVLPAARDLARDLLQLEGGPGVALVGAQRREGFHLVGPWDSRRAPAGRLVAPRSPQPGQAERRDPAGVW